MIKKIKWHRLLILTLGILVIIAGILFLVTSKKDIKMINLVNMDIEEVIEYVKKNKIEYELIEEYSDDIEKNKVTFQNIKEKETVDEKLIIKVSLGPKPVNIYKKFKVNELGRVPIMMYHGIHNMKNEQTLYTGGNVDNEGYNRTTEAFRADLEFYYQNDYRMIKLNDYIKGNIDVDLGKSPIVLTFDDGSENNIKVTGLDNKGNVIIDPNSAVGILEEFKKKYPDYNVTATFFLNIGFFEQPEYNEKY